MGEKKTLCACRFEVKAFSCISSKATMNDSEGVIQNRPGSGAEDYFQVNLFCALPYKNAKQRCRHEFRRGCLALWFRLFVPSIPQMASFRDYIQKSLEQFVHWDQIPSHCFLFAAVLWMSPFCCRYLPHLCLLPLVAHFTPQWRPLRFCPFHFEVELFPFSQICQCYCSSRALLLWLAGDGQFSILFIIVGQLRKRVNFTGKWQ